MAGVAEIPLGNRRTISPSTVLVVIKKTLFFLEEDPPNRFRTTVLSIESVCETYHLFYLRAEVCSTSGVLLGYCAYLKRLYISMGTGFDR